LSKFEVSISILNNLGALKERFFESPYPKRINLILDNENEKENSLRSRELFYLYGYTHQTFRRTWRNYEKKYGLYKNSYKYIHFNDIKSTMPNKLLCITDKELEDYANIDPAVSVENLYDLYSNEELKNKALVLVINNRKFKLSNTKRYITNEPKVSRIINYVKLYTTISNYFSEQGYPFRIKFTKNIYFQEIQIFHDFIENSTPSINDFRDLFQNLLDKLYSPLWDILETFIIQDNLFKKLLNADLNSKIELGRFLKINDLIKSRYDSIHKNFMFILKKQVVEAKNKNYQVFETRFKKIPSEKLKRINNFYDIINNEKIEFNFLFKRLKEFCERIIFKNN